MHRREFLRTAGLSALAAPLVTRHSALGTRLAPARPRPTRAQLQWQRDELAMFLHFGVNTFTDREWGDGSEDPAIFNPERLDARQWARAAKAGGFRAMILTAKHHDGFCLWPSETTKHSVASSPFRGGQGDVVREFVDACRAEGLRPGLYLSPWDRNHPTYGDSPRYMDTYIAQLTELCTRYGQLAEVWFDGANGEGPNGKKQAYDWERIWGTVRRLQPNAVMFSDAGPDVRWCGNERGTAGDPNWSTIQPEAVPYPGADGPGIIDALQHGHADGTVWRPAEVDVSIRPGWFHHAAQDADVRTTDNLFELYCSSVGRNGKLLLNVPPTRSGLLHETDVERLAAMRQKLDSVFATDFAANRTREASPQFGTATIDVNLGAPVAINALRLGEEIATGQTVSRYSVAGLVAGEWRNLSRGTTIGYAKIDRFPAVVGVTKVRVSVENAIDTPVVTTISLYGP